MTRALTATLVLLFGACVGRTPSDGTSENDGGVATPRDGGETVDGGRADVDGGHADVDAGPPEIDCSGFTSINGRAAKGPLVSGAEITVLHVDEGLRRTGAGAGAHVEGNLGAFAIDLPEDGFVSIEVIGNFLDEIRDKVSQQATTVRAYARVCGQPVHVNALTTFAYGRIGTLVDAGATLTDARVQAEAEVVDALGIGGTQLVVDAPFDTLDMLGSSTTANAYVLAVSGVVLQAAKLRTNEIVGFDDAIRVLYATIDADMADGSLDPALRDELAAAERVLDARQLRRRLHERVYRSGHTALPPDPGLALDTDGDGMRNAVDPCPFDATPGDGDADGDGVGDACDACDGDAPYPGAIYGGQSGIDVLRSCRGTADDDGVDATGAADRSVPGYEDYVVDLSPLADLEYVGGALTLSYLRIVDATAIRLIVDVGGPLIFDYNPDLVTLDGLDELQVAGGIHLRGNPLLADADAVADVAVTNQLILEDLPSLGALPPLAVSTLEFVRLRNVGVADLAWLDGLTTVTVSLEIVGNPSLPQCEAEALRDRVLASGATGVVENNGAGACP